MSMATRTDTQLPALHVADSHDLIRVQGAREINLKAVSVEIPKRRLTVFTGVSGSGKSSLVFGTIAAESQRLINETYSAFVQGFMPTLARPEVDVLDGLTATIIVDQERMGANARSTVDTATDGVHLPQETLGDRRYDTGQRHRNPLQETDWCSRLREVVSPSTHSGE
jgi:excinuclease UvrABC ATPase subunit